MTVDVSVTRQAVATNSHRSHETRGTDAPGFRYCADCGTRFLAKSI